MPNSKLPTITDETDGNAIVYVENPADGSVGRVRVSQYRDLYQDKGWKVSTPEAYHAHGEALIAERREIQSASPDLLYPPDGVTAVEAATRRSHAAATKES